VDDESLERVSLKSLKIKEYPASYHRRITIVMKRSDAEPNEQDSNLEDLASPEQLDQVMRVVKPKDWIPAATVSGLTAIALCWSLIGQIPMTVEGRGALISSQKIVPLQSPLEGQLENLRVKDGQCVKRGEVIASVHSAELTEQLNQQRLKRQQLSVQATNVEFLQNQNTQAERNAIATTRNSLLQRQQDNQYQPLVFKDQSLEAIAQQRQSLAQSLKNAQMMLPTLKQRWEQKQNLAQAGALEKDTVLTAERDYHREVQNIADLQAQIQQLAVNVTEVQNRYRQSLNADKEIQVQLKELDTRSQRLRQENLQAVNSRANEVAEVDRSIAELEQQIKERSSIKSPQDGCFLELSVTSGQVVDQGTRLGTLQDQRIKSSALIGAVYFDIKDGKQLKPGMKVQITPDNVKRERFGGIVGTVKSVSSYPVTSTRAAATLGNPELAEELTQKVAKVEVIISLKPDAKNVSGFVWSSSKGPNLKMTPGTTSNVQVSVEERAPITFMLPFLREWSGLK
jgi:HlyD family secretion protein